MSLQSQSKFPEKYMKLWRSVYWSEKVSQPRDKKQWSVHLLTFKCTIILQLLSRKYQPHLILWNARRTFNKCFHVVNSHEPVDHHFRYLPNKMYHENFECFWTPDGKCMQGQAWQAISVLIAKVVTQLACRKMKGNASIEHVRQDHQGYKRYIQYCTDNPGHTTK